MEIILDYPFYPSYLEHCLLFGHIKSESALFDNQPVLTISTPQMKIAEFANRVDLNEAAMSHLILSSLFALYSLNSQHDIAWMKHFLKFHVSKFCFLLFGLQVLKTCPGKASRLLH